MDDIFKEDKGRSVIPLCNQARDYVEVHASHPTQAKRASFHTKVDGHSSTTQIVIFRIVCQHEVAGHLVHHAHTEELNHVDTETRPTQAGLGRTLSWLQNCYLGFRILDGGASLLSRKARPCSLLHHPPPCRCNSGCDRAWARRLSSSSPSLLYHSQAES